MRRVVDPNATGAYTVGDFVPLRAQHLHHLVHVLRLREGVEIEWCNAHAERWLAVLGLESEQIVSVAEHVHNPRTLSIKGETKRYALKLVERMTDVVRPFPVWLAQGMPKGERWEHILCHCTELGVQTFMPFYSERTVVRLREQKCTKKMLRWQKIVEGAAQQSRRVHVPDITLPVDFQGLWAQLPADVPVLLCWEGEHH
ncbi:MAG: RsmE family RNA methyltransferase, partial [Myxococcota bacterium]